MGGNIAACILLRTLKLIGIHHYMLLGAALLAFAFNLHTIVVMSKITQTHHFLKALLSIYTLISIIIFWFYGYASPFSWAAH